MKAIILRYLLKRRAFIGRRKIAISPEYKADYGVYSGLLFVSVNDVYEIGYTIEYSIGVTVDNIVERGNEIKCELSIRIE